MSGLERILGKRGLRVGSDPLTTLLAVQLLAALDMAKRVALLCGRRAGKTQAFLRKAASVMQLHPGCTIPYIALTRGSAEKILWREAEKMNKQLGLGWIPNRSKLTFTAPNGATLFLVGANMSTEIEKLRGQAFLLVGVDEAASFRPSVLNALLNDVLRFALMDHDGALWLMGTPGAACVGYFHDVTTGAKPGWSVHKWTALDNPHIKDAKGWIEREMKENGWTWESPTVRREFLGQWVHDTDALVYKFSRERHMVDALPNDYYTGGKGWAHVLGLDYGYVNAFAWTCWAFRTVGGDKASYCIESGQLREKIPSEVATFTAALVERLGPQSIVGDAGGLGKAYIEETRSRFHIPIKNAEKSDKLAHIELFNDDLRSDPPRAYLVKGKNEDYAEQLEMLQWDLVKVAVKVGGVVRHEDRKAEDPRFENDICDAGLYSNRETRAYLNEPTVKRPVDLSTDDFERQRTDDSWQQTEQTEWWDRD